jgi:tRNA-dihydrouridine synthase
VSALADSGCAAAMIGRGAYGNPWIFQQAAAFLAGAAPSHPTDAELTRIMARHLALSVEECGLRMGVHTMRRHLIWYARGRAGAHEFRRRMVRLEDPEEVLREIRTFLSGGYAVSAVGA